MISENKKCPCCKSCKDCPDFHKIANLKNIGLLIYRYSIHDKDVTNKQECLQKPSGTMSDIIIIVHNETNVNISADKYLLELDKYTSCPRCKYKLEQAKKFFAKIPRIEKLDTVTMCNHCQAKVKKSCQECSKITNTFIASKMQKNKFLKELLLWLSNVENILEKHEKLNNLHRRTGSQLHTDCLRSTRSLNHQPQIGQLLEFEDLTQSVKYSLETKSESALLHFEQHKSISNPFQQAIELKEISKDKRSLTKSKSSAELIREFQNKLDTKLVLEEREKEEKRHKEIEEDEKRHLVKAKLERKTLRKLESEKNKKDVKRSPDEELKDTKRIKKKIELLPIIPNLSVKNINDKDRKKVTDILKVKKSLIIQEEKSEKEQKSQVEKKRQLKEKDEKQKVKKEEEERRRRKDKKRRNFEEELRRNKDEEKISKRQSDKHHTYAQELKRTLAEQAKQKENKSKIKSQQEGTTKEIAVENKPNEDRREDNEDTELESKTTKEPLSVKRESKRHKGVTEPKSKGINMNQIKVRTPSPDDLILHLVKLKQSDLDRAKKSRPKRLSQLNIPSVKITAHKGHKNKKVPECIICNDSELELDIENIVLNNTKSEKINDIIIGGKILKCKPRIEKEVGDIEISPAPLFFKSTFKDDNIVNVPKQEIPEYMTVTKESKPYSVLPSKYVSFFLH